MLGVKSNRGTIKGEFADKLRKQIVISLKERQEGNTLDKTKTGGQMTSRKLCPKTTWRPTPLPLVAPNKSPLACRLSRPHGLRITALTEKRHYT